MKANYKQCNKWNTIALTIYQGVTIKESFFLVNSPCLKIGFAKNYRNMVVSQ